MKTTLFSGNKLKTNTISGLCYSGHRDEQNPYMKIYPSEVQTREDLELIKNCGAIRIYSCHNLVNIPKIAADYNLKVYLGAWIDKNRLRNIRELRRVVKWSTTLKNIKAITIGNEVLRQKYISKQELIKYIRFVNDKTNLPVSTSDHWDIWLEHPELVKEVDFIAVHIFPYWHGIAIEKAIDFIDEKIILIRKKYPKKQITLYDNGWPSAGQTINKAVPSPKNQKQYIQEIINYCKINNLQQFYFEAFDEPWKKYYEKDTGANWGIFDDSRKPKK